MTKTLEGAFLDFNNSSKRCVPSMQKKSLSFREDPLLNDLNLLTRLLFLLVILKKVFSMRNLKICFQLHINSVKVLINNFKFLFAGNKQNFFIFY